MDPVTELPRPRHQPVRTCIGCRKQGMRNELIRLVAEGDGSPVVLVDVRRRMAGRGAWLHPSNTCLTLASKRRAFVRALPGTSEITAVQSYLAAVVPPADTPVKAGKPSKPESGSED
ncbi:YlxR family protein [Arthrobacter sp. GN70]|nr:YlxR family protein [Arthrobacter sp. GN70]